MNRKWVLTAILISIFLSAMEATVVTTAMPSIIRDLQGMAYISLIFSVYLLVTAVSTPIYGKLADLFGRKRILCMAIIIFIVGSVLCGVAQTMVQLIIFRALQALGAGAIMPITTTIIGDIYTTEEQTRMQALFSGVWAISGVIGPLIGGLIVELLDWRWIFWINLPFGLLSLVMLWVTFRETFRPVKQKIDWAGAASFLISISALLYVLLFGGSQGYLSPLNLLCLVLFVLFLFVFIVVERRVKEPFMPFELLRNKLILIPNLFGFLIFSFLISTTVYFPIWLQQIKLQTPMVSGFALACTTFGWPLGATISGHLMKRFPPKWVSTCGSALLIISGALLANIGLDTPVPLFFVIMFLTGLGFGLCITVFMILMQNTVEGRQRGVTMSTNALMNTLGQTIFIAIFGAVYNAVSSNDPVNGMSNGIHSVFLIVFVLTVAAFLIAIQLPNISSKELFGSGKGDEAAKTGSGQMH